MQTEGRSIAGSAYAVARYELDDYKFLSVIAPAKKRKLFITDYQWYALVNYFLARDNRYAERAI